MMLVTASVVLLN